MKKIKTATITQTINVNQLAEILEKHFGLKNVEIEKARVADICNQWKPLNTDIGIGGVLSIEFSGEAVRP